jgi:hypothetical protein
MKKILTFSIIALIYITVFKITDSETGDIGSATILVLGVPVFVFLSFFLFIVSLYFCIKKRSSDNSLYVISLIINLVSIILTFISKPN